MIEIFTTMETITGRANPNLKQKLFGATEGEEY
jgi:hypothetical protein